MAVHTIPCRVCGKMFTPCNKTSGALGAFNYREVACSPECGAEYLRRVQVARQKSSEAPDAVVSTDDRKNNDNKSEQKRTRGRPRKNTNE
jgi:hypothetical protein